MAAPTHSDIVYYEATDAAPANDTDPIGGAITAAVIADNALDKTINTPVFDASAQTYYGVFYIKNNATGNLTNARVFNRCALKDNALSGTITFGFIDGSDSGSKILVVGLVSGVLQTEYVTCPAAAGFVPSVRSYDAGKVFVCEFVNSSNASAIPNSVITVSQSGVTMGVLRGTGGNPTGKDLAVRQLYNFGTIAVASTKNTTISAADRKTAPGSISAFGQGCKWDGLDESIAVPTNELDTTQYIGIVYKLVIPANLPTPAYGRLQIAVNIVGNAVP